MNVLYERRFELAACAVVALATGVASSSVAVAVACALAVHAAWQARLLQQLARALRLGQRLEPPFPGGAWGDVYRAARALQLRGRKRKRRLKRFVSRFQHAASVLPDAIVLLGRDFRVEWRNPAAARLVGLEERSSVGAPITTHVRDPALVEYLRAGDFTNALTIPAPGERSTILSVRITPFGRRRQWILFARDITRSYYLDRTRADFVANVSHELRTPLTVFSGNLEILAEQGTGAVSPDRSLARIESMRESVERMQTLIDGLLDLSRVEMANGDRSWAPIDMPALLEGVAEEARSLGAASGHVVELDAQGALWLLGDLGELRSAVSNLVGNAVRHTPPRTRIDVRWQADDGEALLEVSDNGSGIAAHHLPRLTERFYRVDAGRAADSGGTGLGLAIVKHVLENHDAALAVTSREGVGTTFTCRFPAARVARATSTVAHASMD